MPEDRVALERGLESGGLGFRLVPTRVSWPTELQAGTVFLLRATWVTRNAGRLDQRLPLKVYLTDARGREKFSEVDQGFDETSWVRGESYPVISIYHLPNHLPPGEDDVRIAMVDETGKPQIHLAIQGQDAQTRYRLGTIRILPPPQEAGGSVAPCPWPRGLRGIRRGAPQQAKFFGLKARRTVFLAW